ncbi:MAG TPA: hypothetical protein VKU82_15105 [Planctomycetaceae bacterium]|nr:hypothetical protein [Planctomycetaceae bacterium]
MQARFSTIQWGALCAGLFLMSGPVSIACADGWWKFTGKNSASSDCPEELQNCPTPRRGCKFCRGRGCRFCRGNVLGCFLPMDPNYCDFRDTRIYSAQGYNVPVTIPLAPVVRVFNYGWGVPSVRYSQAGPYAAWYPDRPFTQTGGNLPGGRYPMVYYPTDTTQLGAYYNYVPTWQPWR